jgi:hypothetical protein
MSSSLEYIDYNHSEWKPMWEELSKQPMNEGDPLCINDGQCWEYMSSSADHHYFRHNNHPQTNRPEHIYLERNTSRFKWVAMSA